MLPREAQGTLSTQSDRLSAGARVQSAAVSERHALGSVIVTAVVYDMVYPRGACDGPPFADRG